jgi:AcrR family transcriptional regulator
VRQLGLAGLSIDAVAKEAGISKSSVVYDFRNKNALLAAFIEKK